MEKIYVIVACNNEEDDYYYESELGFVETEQEAKRVIDALEHTRMEDHKKVTDLKSRCKCLNALTDKCIIADQLYGKGCGVFKDYYGKCPVEDEVIRIENKDMYRSCYGRVGSVSYRYRELKKMF